MAAEKLITDDAQTHTDAYSGGADGQHSLSWVWGSRFPYRLALAPRTPVRSIVVLPEKNLIIMKPHKKYQITNH